MSTKGQIADVISIPCHQRHQIASSQNLPLLTCYQILRENNLALARLIRFREVQRKLIRFDAHCLKDCRQKINCLNKGIDLFPRANSIRVTNDPRYMYEFLIIARLHFADIPMLAERLTAEICDFYRLSPNEFMGHFSIKVPYSYPIYELGYVGEVLKAAKLNYSFDNLFSLGRQGLFRYDYMTHRVMESADYLAKFLQTGMAKKEFLREPIAKALFF